MIKFTIETPDNTRQTIEIPEDISMNLMEVLKASEYQIPATCGGMALCATCQIQVVEGQDSLPAPGDQELDMLDTLPEAGPDNRLACQIPVNKELDGTVIRLVA